MYTHPLLTAGMIGGQELIIILVIVLILFGGNKIPKLGDGLGKGIRNFRRALNPDEPEGEAEVVEAEVIQEGQPKSKETKSDTKKLDSKES